MLRLAVIFLDKKKQATMGLFFFQLELEFIPKINTVVSW